MPNHTNFRKLRTALCCLLFALLACNLPGIDDSLTSDIPDAGDHISDDQLQSDIQDTRDAFFEDHFNGDQLYDSSYSANQDNASVCDFGFPQGQSLDFHQEFIPGNDSTPDQVQIRAEGETFIYENYQEKGPYVFCRSLTGENSRGKTIGFLECLSFNQLGFSLHVEFYNEDLDEDAVCFEERYTYTGKTNAGTYNFGHTWDSGPVCGEEFEVQYKWQVALIQTEDGAISGTIRFHDCPGGGQVAYSVRGQEIEGQYYAILQGTKSGGAGKLYDESPDEQYFRVSYGVAPEKIEYP